MTAVEGRSLSSQAHRGEGDSCGGPVTVQPDPRREGQGFLCAGGGVVTKCPHVTAAIRGAVITRQCPPPLTDLENQLGVTNGEVAGDRGKGSVGLRVKRANSSVQLYTYLVM